MQNLTLRTLTWHLSLQRQYPTSKEPLKPLHTSYSPTTCMLLTKPSPLYKNYWRNLRTKTNQKTDKEQFTRSNAATARWPTHLYISETGRNLNVQLTVHRWATRNGDLNNNISEHHLQTNHRINWNSVGCVTLNSTNYYQRIILESWFTNLEQTPLSRCLQLPAPYKRLVGDINNRQTTDWPTTIHVQT